MIRMVVVLPAPLPPTKPVRRPRPTVNVTSSSTRRSPKCLVTPSMVSIVSPSGGGGCPPRVRRYGGHAAAPPPPGGTRASTARRRRDGRCRDGAWQRRRAASTTGRGSPAGADDAVLVRPHDGLDAVAQLQLLQHVRHVGLHRGVADEELRRRSRRCSARGRAAGAPRSRARSARRTASASARREVTRSWWRRGRAAAVAVARLITRRVTSGASRASPAATVRTASISCSGEAFFSRNPLAPASSAWNSVSSLSNVVRMRTAGGSGSAAIRRAASMPSTPGICTSRHTTSGVGAARPPRPPRAPSAASPTTDGARARTRG